MCQTPELKKTFVYQSIYFRMTEFLKNNPIVLRHCLLYEFLRKNPAEWTYHVFYNTVGRDVIEHEDVQFWFKQFRHGRLDEEDDNE
ncbi:hypothetical protein CAEBREN_25164 [Caenorhabditis brenneri]|uniref:Mos1 transposase HTH domain-containing protein n=1 Tax=Caenorhabditis brenneri TaxID=135651 RepID=G0P298_CAEBE|nr:hypothetical protein CAEBREN_25164 [Caenorhabditis brenneri]